LEQRPVDRQIAVHLPVARYQPGSHALDPKPAILSGADGWVNENTGEFIALSAIPGSARARRDTQPEGHRPVIRESDAHARPDPPARHGRVRGAGRPDGVIEELWARFGSAAEEKLGRVPLAVSAASVNCGTSSNPPATSRTKRFIFPAPSAN